MVILIILVFSFIIALETPQLIRGKYWWELVVFGLLLSLGLAISILMVMGINLPYVSTAIGQIIRDVLRLK